MADEIGYRVTRSGELAVYRVTATGLIRITFPDAALPPPPDWLIPVLRLRRLLHDPEAADIFFFEQAPAGLPLGMAFTTGDGVYYAKNAVGAFAALSLRLGDTALEDALETKGGSVLAGACLAIDYLLARVHPDDYITAGNAGGQSVSFPALESLIAFYRALKKDLQEEEARQTGADTGRLFQVERPAVGGVDV